MAYTPFKKGQEPPGKALGTAVSKRQADKAQKAKLAAAARKRAR